MDYGRFKYEQKKKTRQGRKKTHSLTTKEVRLRPLTGIHDVEFKMRHARDFFAEGHRVLVTVVFRGREMTHQEIGREMLKKVIQLVEDVAKVERETRMEGNRMSILLMPKAKGEAHAKTKDQEGGGQKVQADGAGKAPVPAAGQEPPAVSQGPQEAPPTA
jgi:translation initiation factor IF-3